MLKVIAISGSLRKQSFNTAFLQNAKKLAPEVMNIQLRTLEGIPLYNQDDEEHSGVPEAAQKLKEEIATADAMIICTPEYNNSIPGVLKNALDWLSRPPKDIPRVFHNKIIALMGVTIGNMGTINAQSDWLSIIRTLGMLPWFGKKLFISSAKDKFDSEGNILDEKAQNSLSEYLSGLSLFVQKIQQANLQSP
jgi:NAD(P)H-dependent FMN reductase